MPFVPRESRSVAGLGAVCRAVALSDSPGLLAYVLYAVCRAWSWDGRARYDRRAALLGALRSCQALIEAELLEYEDTKREENGDVFALDLIQHAGSDGEGA